MSHKIPASDMTDFENKKCIIELAFAANILEKNKTKKPSV